MDKYRCEKACSEEGITDHEFIAEHGDYNEIYEIKCLKCNHQYKVGRHSWLSSQIINEVKPRRAYLTKWPHIEPHSGEMVHSKEHEKELLTRLGYHAAPHGVDERYSHKEKDWDSWNRYAKDR
jgi:hypothetical protein